MSVHWILMELKAVSTNVGAEGALGVLAERIVIGGE